MIFVIFLGINIAFYQCYVNGENISTTLSDNVTQTTERSVKPTVSMELATTKTVGNINITLDTTAKETTPSGATTNLDGDLEILTEVIKITTDVTQETDTSKSIDEVIDRTTKMGTSSLENTSPDLEALTESYEVQIPTSSDQPPVTTTELTLTEPNEPTHLKIDIPRAEFEKTMDIASFYKINTSFIQWEPSENKTGVTLFMIDYFNLSESILDSHLKAVDEGLETYPTFALWNTTLTKIQSVKTNILQLFLFRVGPGVIAPWEESKKGVAILLVADFNKILDKIRQQGVKDTFVPAYCKEPFDRFSRLWGHVTKFLIAIKVYAYCIICFLGIIGNLLSYAVLSKDKINTSVFTLKVLAIIDSVHLILRAVTEPYFVAYSYTNWINKTLDGRVTHEYAIATLYMRPVVEMAQMASAWTVVYLTMDRFIAICFPFKAINFCTIKVARIGISAIVCFCVLYNIPVFFSMIHTFSEHKCLGTLMVFRYLSEFGKNWYYRIVYEFTLNLIFRTFGPVLLVFILNVKLVHELRDSRKRREKISSQPSADTENKDRNITVTLITISFVFLICIVPMVGQKIFDIVVYVVLDEKVTKELAVELILSEYSHIYEASGVYGAVVDLLLIVNSAINIIIYCLVRREFARKLLFLFCPCRLKKDSTIVSNTASSKLNSRSNYSDSPL